MKRSARVPLLLLPSAASIIVAACGPVVPQYDPCSAATYNAPACAQAVASSGYYYSGIWYPHTYGYNALYYGNQRTIYVNGGGVTRVVPSASYAPSTSVNGGAARPGVTSGGFGGIGAGMGGDGAGS